MLELMKAEPVCPYCNGAMTLVKRKDGRGDSWFRHAPDAKCPVVADGRTLLDAFCEERNLLEAYNVLCRIFRLPYLDPDEFYRICLEADRRRIWNDSDIDMKTLPYMLSLLRNVMVYERDESGKSHRSRISWAELRNDRRTIVIRCLTGDGTPVDPGITSLSNPAIERVRADIDWIRAEPGLVEKLKRFCRERKTRHDAPS